MEKIGRYPIKNNFFGIKNQFNKNYSFSYIQMKIIINSIALVKKQITDVKTYGISELFRKFYLLIKFLPLILMDIIAIVPCLIIRLISPWFIIRIDKIPATNFGALALHTGRYYCKKKFVRED